MSRALTVVVIFVITIIITIMVGLTVLSMIGQITSQKSDMSA